MEKLALPIIIATTIFISACANKNDLIAEIGRGESIRMVGDADNFDCDDPTYFGVSKVETSTFVFEDGTTKHLCKLSKQVQ